MASKSEGLSMRQRALPSRRENLYSFISSLDSMELWTRSALCLYSQWTCDCHLWSSAKGASMESHGSGNLQHFWDQWLLIHALTDNLREVKFLA